MSETISQSGTDGENQSRRGGAVTGAYNCDGCSGCSWAEKHSGGWCHMFKHAPDELPCSQHDKFAVEREVMNEMVRRNPAVINLLVMAHEKAE
jgi:hypothetical protein